MKKFEFERRLATLVIKPRIVIPDELRVRQPALIVPPGPIPPGPLA